MQDQRIDMSEVAEAEMSADQTLLALIVDDDQSFWAVAELEREFGGSVEDSLARLYAAGLVHRVEGGFVTATRAAMLATTTICRRRSHLWRATSPSPLSRTSR